MTILAKFIISALGIILIFVIFGLYNAYSKLKNCEKTNSFLQGRIDNLIKITRDSTSEERVIDMIYNQLRVAEKKFPGFPHDIVHGACILVEEAGEAAKEALDFFYGRSENTIELEKEVAQTGAMAIRFLLRLLNEKHYPVQKT